MAMRPKPVERDEAAEMRRAQIQKAAMRVFSEKGFGKATIPDIARRAGVAVGTIYIYFRTKEEMLLSILESHLLVEPLSQFFEMAGKVEDRDLLSALVEVCLSFGHDNAREFIFLLSEILRDPYIRKMYARQSLKPALKLVEDYLKRRMEDGAFSRDIDPRAASRALAGMVIGMVILYGIEYEKGGFARQRGAASSQAVQLVLEGLEERDGGSAGLKKVKGASGGGAA